MNEPVNPAPGFTFFAKRHWQAKYGAMLADLRLLEAAYTVPAAELTPDRAAEIARVAEGFFKTARELADWIYEETKHAVDPAQDIRVQPVHDPSALKLCDAIAQTAKHHTRDETKPNKPDPITAMVGMVYNSEQGTAKADIAWSMPTTALETVDALDLAKRCVAEWETYCEAKGLDVNGEGPPLIEFLSGQRGRITDGRRDPGIS